MNNQLRLETNLDSLNRIKEEKPQSAVKRITRPNTVKRRPPDKTPISSNKRLPVLGESMCRHDRKAGCHFAPISGHPLRNQVIRLLDHVFNHFTPHKRTPAKCAHPKMEAWLV